MTTETRQSTLGENMAVDAKSSLPPILLPFAPVHKRGLGVATGVVGGGLVWLATAVLLLKGGAVVGPTLSLLSQYFYGYRVSWPGSVVGAAWGFAIGFLMGWSIAAIRNGFFRLWLKIICFRAELERKDLLDL